MPNDNDRLGASPGELAGKRTLSGETQLPERQRLSVADDRVRAIRDRVGAARTRIEIAMRFTMHSEVREELRNVQSDLAVALAYIGG